MNESLLIQVDEVTQGMLETIEERIFEGTRTAQESGIKELSALLEQAEQTMQRSVDAFSKQVKQTNERIEPLQAEMQRVGRQMQEAITTSRSQVIELSNQLQQLLPEMEQRILKHVEQSATLLLKEQEPFREQFDQIHTAFKQQAAQNEELIKYCTALQSKIEALEADVKWLQQPIWKRLFGGEK